MIVKKMVQKLRIVVNFEACGAQCAASFVTQFLIFFTFFYERVLSFRENSENVHQLQRNGAKHKNSKTKKEDAFLFSTRDLMPLA
jgi:hypothetical protein